MKITGGIVFISIGLIILFFSANAHQSNETLKISKRSFNLEKPHKFEHYDKCNKDFMESFGKVMMGSICKPRPAVVEIIFHSSDMLIIPSKVMVNRCDGMCHAKQSCLATEKKEIPIMVQQLNLLDRTSMPKCGVVYVEEHIRCKCKCTVMKEDCNEKQDYQPGECMCLCMNAEEKKDCLHEGKTWDDGRCSCQCPLQKECSTGLVWVAEHCKCAKLMDENEMNLIST